jgi:hypothetical protein
MSAQLEQVHPIHSQGNSRPPQLSVYRRSATSVLRKITMKEENFFLSFLFLLNWKKIVLKAMLSPTKAMERPKSSHKTEILLDLIDGTQNIFVPDR